MRKGVGVLISGRGSNMEALIRAAERSDYPAEIVTVVSNRPDAAGLRIAAGLGIEATTIDHLAFPDREGFEERLDQHLRSRRIDYIACAGFMRVLTQRFLDGWPDRVVNIHPSLLPSYGGLNTHARAIADGVRIHGCTVHFVRAAIDNGPIIAQAAVEVQAGDTAGTLAARVLRAEHVLYPRVMGWLAAGAITLEGERVIYGFEATAEGATLMSPSRTP